MSTQLRKPVFCKVKQLEHSRSGYNVYVKVISVQKSQTQSKTLIVRAVVGDETGCANAFFKGESVNMIQQGKVIAIRNGTIKYIKNRISLQIDLFGRITSENVDIKTDSTNNISDKEIQRKPRRKFNNNGQNRQRRQQNYDRRPRRQSDNQQRRPRRQDNGQRRPQRRQYDGQRPQRRQYDNNERPQRRQYDNERPQRRQYDNERPQRRQYDGQRPQRRQDQQRRPRQDQQRRPRRDNDFDRRPRRQGDQQRRPRREDNGDRRPRQGQNRGDRRPPVQFTKIGAIQPADEGINFFAQVVDVEEVGKRARVILGDETGIVKGFLYKVDAIKVGESIVVFKAEAKVVKQHIEIQVMDGGKVDVARRRVEQVNKSYNVSAKEWVEADQ